MKKMMKNLLILTILILAMFLVSCAPGLTEEETLAELDSLSAEELNAVMSDDESALAGQAYYTPKLRSLKTATKYYFTWLSCTDSDGGEKPEVKGKLVAVYDSNGKKGTKSYEDVCYSEKSENLLQEYYCVENKFAYKYVECEFGCFDGACQTAKSVCGNGVSELGEGCDDGNTKNLDGCDAFCKLEPKPVCGDKVIGYPETCDDGNLVNGDGCSSACQTEVKDGLLINVTDSTVCGDGVVQGMEQCDDGNAVSGDGCSASCQSEATLINVTDSTVCGDGVVQGMEQCDDGDTTSGDGCSASCQSEATLINVSDN